MIRCCLRIAAVVAVLFAVAAEARAATITAGTPIPISPTEFAVPIEVVDAAELIAWQFDLVYDPTDVQVDTTCDPLLDLFCDLFTGFATEGDFFSAGAPFNLLIPGIVDLDPATSMQSGLLLAVHGAYGGSPPAPSGDGVLVYIRFVILGTGDSPITVVNPSVTESAVPEPATVLLMTIGLPLLGVRSMWLRRHRDR